MDKSKLYSRGNKMWTYNNMLTFSPSSIFPRLLSGNLKTKLYKTILEIVLYGCQTWYFILTEEFRQRVSENGILMRIFGPKRM
jgi:hypothetical protein